MEILIHSIRKKLKERNGVESYSDDSEPTLDEIREGIKEGLREAMRGEGIPLSQFLAELDDE